MTTPTPREADDIVERNEFTPDEHAAAERELINLARARDLGEIGALAALRELAADLDRLATRARGTMPHELDGDEYGRLAENISEGMVEIAGRLAAIPVAEAATEDGKLPEPLGDLASWFRAAAAGRREYAENAPKDQADVLQVQASVLDSAARLASGDTAPMHWWLPSWRWGELWSADQPVEDLQDSGPTPEPAAPSFTGPGTSSPGRAAALVPSIEAMLFAPLTDARTSTLDDRLRPLVHARLAEWAAAVQPTDLANERSAEQRRAQIELDAEENGGRLWRRLLAECGPCSCTVHDDGEVPCADGCGLCRDLPEGWPCPAWAGGGYGDGALASEPRSTHGETKSSWTQPGITTAVAARNAMMVEKGDTGPVVAEDRGVLGRRWWTAARVYCEDVERHAVVSVPRHPPAAADEQAPVSGDAG